MDGRPEGSSDLEMRVVALEAELAGLRRSTIRIPRGLRRPAVVVIALAVALAVPGMALANHVFTDVPTTSTFHTQIATLAGAGITRGCNVGSTKFCPADFVRRDAMAGFLTRGLARLGVDRFDGPPAIADTAIASLAIRSEGTAYLHTIATITLSVTGAGSYPCGGRIWISVDGKLLNESLTSIMPFRQPTTPVALGSFQLTGQSVRVVNGGTHSVELRYDGVVEGSCTVSLGRGYLTSTVVPFGFDGGPATTPD